MLQCLQWYFERQFRAKWSLLKQLLQSFWTRLHAGTERQAALELFGLGDAADYPAIRRRYRQLVSRHHPDRGGSTTRLQSINTAMEILERYYRSG